MAYKILLTATAREHLRGFRIFEQRIIVKALKEQLSHHPLKPSRRRKALRENPLSRWELRIRNYRVFYEVNTESRTVEVKAIGYKKHNELFIGSERFKL